MKKKPKFYGFVSQNDEWGNKNVFIEIEYEILNLLMMQLGNTNEYNVLKTMHCCKQWCPLTLHI